MTIAIGLLCFSAGACFGVVLMGAIIGNREAMESPQAIRQPCGVEIMKSIQVQLEDGQLAMCTVIERMGFNHDVGERTIWVSHDGKEFMAVRKLGAWRKWTSADRARPLIEYLVDLEKRRKQGQ